MTVEVDGGGRDITVEELDRMFGSARKIRVVKDTLPEPLPAAIDFENSRLVMNPDSPDPLDMRHTDVEVPADVNPENVSLAFGGQPVVLGDSVAPLPILGFSFAQGGPSFNVIEKMGFSLRGLASGQLAALTEEEKKPLTAPNTTRSTTRRERFRRANFFPQALSPLPRPPIPDGSPRSKSHSLSALPGFQIARARKLAARGLEATTQKDGELEDDVESTAAKSLPFFPSGHGMNVELPTLLQENAASIPTHIEATQIRHPQIERFKENGEAVLRLSAILKMQSADGLVHMMNGEEEVSFRPNFRSLEEPVKREERKTTPNFVPSKASTHSSSKHSSTKPTEDPIPIKPIPRQIVLTESQRNVEENVLRRQRVHVQSGGLKAAIGVSHSAENSLMFENRLSPSVPTIVGASSPKARRKLGSEDRKLVLRDFTGDSWMVSRVSKSIEPKIDHVTNFFSELELAGVSKVFASYTMSPDRPVRGRSSWTTSGDIVLFLQVNVLECRGISPEMSHMLERVMRRVDEVFQLPASRIFGLCATYLHRTSSDSTNDFTEVVRIYLSADRSSNHRSHFPQAGVTLYPNAGCATRWEAKHAKSEHKEKLRTGSNCFVISVYAL